MFWENFSKLCLIQGESPTAVAKKNGYSSASVVKWKTGSPPRNSTLKILADYFGVTVDYLLGNECPSEDENEGDALQKGDNMFKKIFIDLCNKKKESPSSVCRKIGLSNATFSCWTDESVPRRATLQRIAAYFDVTVDYLLGNEKEKPAAEDELTENVVIYHRDGKTVTKKFSKEQMEMLAKMIDAIPEEEDE